MFGLSAELNGQMLAPIGTVYDPFVCRSLDALIYALYSGAKFVFAGTPSGVTLAPEGGAPVDDHAIHRRRAAQSAHVRALLWARSRMVFIGRDSRLF
ncbi:MAG: hypothetical protein R2932_59475 [Caldilineaceae bacterium]